MLLILLLSNGIIPKFYSLSVSNVEHKLEDNCLKQLLLKVKEKFISKCEHFNVLPVYYPHNLFH